MIYIRKKKLRIWKPRDRQEDGYTLIELLVGLALFGIIGSSVAGVMISTFRSLGRENRLAAAAENLRLASHILSSELRMASHVSPYLPGMDTNAVNCRANFELTDDSVAFLVVRDDLYASGGLEPYMVGYRYDPLTKTLYRGEVESPSITGCVVPEADPLDPEELLPIAENVIRVDVDDDGEQEPIFSQAGSAITIALGTSVKGEGLQDIIHSHQTRVTLRVN